MLELIIAVQMYNYETPLSRAPVQRFVAAEFRELEVIPSDAQWSLIFRLQEYGMFECICTKVLTRQMNELTKEVKLPCRVFH